MKRCSFLILLLFFSLWVSADQQKTLVAYYSYTGNCSDIVTLLTSQMEADVLEIQPAEKGLKYDADNYALGTQLLNAIKENPSSASSYPAIDPVTTERSYYHCHPSLVETDGCRHADFFIQLWLAVGWQAC